EPRPCPGRRGGMKPPRKNLSGKREVRPQERFAGKELRLVRPEDDQTTLVANDPTQQLCPAEGALGPLSSPPSQGITGTLQALYRELAEAVYPELQRRSEGGEEQARGLLARLRGVGERLGVRFPERATADLTAEPESLVRRTF